MKKMIDQCQVIALIISVVGSLFLSGMVYGGFKQEFIDFKVEMNNTVELLNKTDNCLIKELKELNKNISEMNGYHKAKKESGN